MKSFRLIVHQKTFSEDDLVINQKDYAEAKKNDIVEIFQNPVEDENQKKAKKVDSAEEYPHLLLQIKTFRDDLQARETISVEQSVATAFGLQLYTNVVVRIVNPADVALDSIELTFKDQYLGRSEMWRLKNSLVSTCVYVNKKLEFCGGSIRCQVFEMWAKGEKVACGVITEDTKIVFRSSSAMVYIFLQMSSEMWDFDIYGNLYFEKAVNGFLADLFEKWKKNGSSHEVTIVMFSRTFYKASQLEEFPEHMRECLQKDSKGKYYEDFYRVTVQNERYDDWSNTLVTLRRIFQQYLKVVLEYHKRPDMVVPSAVNSSAAQGNFLEVLNMSLNVFEKHYLDRSFDRTGQLSVVITPGVGVFEVDRELTNITKQRIIDGGVGSDLVCVGEQPLHAVPLLKFRNKATSQNVPSDYSMPHWINLSFYSTKQKFGYSSFTPRLKVPPPLTEKEMKKLKKLTKTTLVPEEDTLHNSFFDYDAYDSAIFQTINPHHAQDSYFSPTHQFNISKNTNCPPKISSNSLEFQATSRGMARNLSDPEIIQHKSDVNNTRSKPIEIPPGGSNFLGSSPLEEKDFSPPVRMVVGSEGSPPHESRALINPFDPSHVTVKLTSNRRRWTHIFPKGPTGVLIQQHHYQAVPKSLASEVVKSSDRMKMPDNKEIVVTPALQEYCKKKPFQNNLTVSAPLSIKQSTKTLTLLWGATGEQEWTPALTTGVDWKSLTIPACLPITTDYFPDQKTLNNDYLVSLYSLVPDSVYADFAQQRTSCRKPSTTDEVFRELISQRLSQGFQIILQNCDNPVSKNHKNQYPRNPVLKKGLRENDEMFFLSVGRVFHKIALLGNTISVTRYRPRHPHPGFRFQYRYRFHAPKHENYEDSYAVFNTEKLEQYNWNYLDHYVCTGGYTTDFVLVDALKYWRLRIYFLNNNHADTKKIIEGSNRCDIYSWPQYNDQTQVAEGFLRFVETAINKIKKSNIVTKKPRMSLSVQTLPPLLQPRRNSVSSVFQNTSRASDKHIPNTLSTTLSATPLLKNDSSGREIVDTIKHPSHGLSFVTSHHGLPNYTFVTADAVGWLISYMEGITNCNEGIQVLQKLFKENLIRHASGEYTKNLVHGFSLFYILPEKDEKDVQVSGDLEAFETDFFEVEVKPPLNWGTSQPPQFLSNDVNLEYFGFDNEDLEPEYKRMRLETDVTNKSDRTEWGHVKYQTVFVPDRAYELCIEWLTSSGSIIGELLFGWHRKAQLCGFQMVPVPHDPFALPSSGTTDPLRAPIFIPLNIESLETDQIFREFSKKDWEVKLLLLKEAIIQRFGFLHSVSEIVESSDTKEYQYVHATGTIFIMISSTACKPERRKSINLAETRHSTNRYSVHADIVPSPHEAYITRHVSTQSKSERHPKNIGFLWAWNHMVSRRWRTNQGVDTAFQLKILKDFREFCNNEENRLINFWRDSCDSALLVS